MKRKAARKLKLVADRIDNFFKVRISRCQDERTLAILNYCKTAQDSYFRERENLVGLVWLNHIIFGQEERTI